MLVSIQKKANVDGAKTRNRERFIYHSIVTIIMSIIDKLDVSAKKIEQFNDGVITGLEVSACNIDGYNGRIHNFFADVAQSPVDTIKQVYESISGYFRK